LAPGAPLTGVGLALRAARVVAAGRRRATRVTAAGSTPSRIADAVAVRCAGPMTAAGVEIGAVAGEFVARAIRLAGSLVTVIIVAAGGQARSVAADQIVGTGDGTRAVAPALAVAGAGRLQHRFAHARCRLARSTARVAFAVTAMAGAGGAAGGRPLIEAVAAGAAAPIAAADLGSTVGRAEAGPTVTDLLRAARAATPPAPVRAAGLAVTLGPAAAGAALAHLILGARTTGAAAAVIAARVGRGALRSARRRWRPCRLRR
jgi:hypothetical protein